jgi:regulator of sigma E protease
MSIGLLQILQLILCFALLITLHEGGHFLFARLFGIRVEKFCLFFDWKFSIKLFSYKGTDYHLGWIPLGGYVKIAGMIDESMDTEQMMQPMKPDEFRAKPAYQRLLVMVGGVLVNFITALIIYIGILFTWGQKYIPLQNMTYGFLFNEEAEAHGFKDGDIPLRTNLGELDRLNGDFYRALADADTIVVLRDGKMQNVIPGVERSLLEITSTKSVPPYISQCIPAVIEAVNPDSPAEKAGLRAGDHITGLDSTALTTWNEFQALMNVKNNELQTAAPGYVVELQRVSLVVQHSDATIDTLCATLPADLKLGILFKAPDYKIVHQEYSFLQSIPAGIIHGCNVLTGYVSDLKYLFTKEGASSVGSFGTIVNLFPSAWDWQRFWELTAFISLMLAFMNILPIPALDGGHVLFLLYEVITRRKPSDRFLEITQTIGMYLLLALMAFAIFNDCSNLGVF